MNEAKRFKIYLTGACLLALGIITTYFFIRLTDVPESQFLEEDGFVENLTVAFYLLAVCMALASALFARSATGRRLAALGVAGLALLLALEELSFGERYFGYHAPRILGIKLDAIHDVFHLTLKWLKVELYTRPMITAGMVVLVAAVAAVLIWRSRVLLTDGFLRIWHSPAGRYVLLCVGFGAAGLLADLRSDFWPLLKLLEETFEAEAALALVFAGTTFFGRRRQVDHGPLI